MIDFDGQFQCDIKVNLSKLLSNGIHVLIFSFSIQRADING